MYNDISMIFISIIDGMILLLNDVFFVILHVYCDHKHYCVTKFGPCWHAQFLQPYKVEFQNDLSGWIQCLADSISKQIRKIFTEFWMSQSPWSRMRFIYLRNIVWSSKASAELSSLFMSTTMDSNCLVYISSARKHKTKRNENNNIFRNKWEFHTYFKSTHERVAKNKSQKQRQKIYVYTVW